MCFLCNAALYFLVYPPCPAISPNDGRTNPINEEAGEARLYCHSEGRERKEQAIAKRFADTFEAELQKLHEGLSKPRCEKNPLCQYT